MSVTIYDVAKKAGVGIGTVSRVLNNSSQITPKTKAKVLAAIEELNYQPHQVAQSLARRKTNTIACIIPFFTGYFYVELFRGIQRKINIFQNDLILYSVEHTDMKETFLEKTLKERKVDGVLVVSLQIGDDIVARFKEENFPMVLVDSYHPGLNCITVDNVQGAYLATQHLIKLNHKRIGMIDGQLISFPARLRLEGYKTALQDHRIEFEERIFVACDFTNEADGFNKEAGYTAMQQLLCLGDDCPHAVFVSSDIQAIGAMNAIRERGLSTPEDIAIVGFDDIELAVHLGLTTMRQPIRDMGELAVELLMHSISGTSNKSIQHQFDTTLVVRRSCGSCN